MYVVPSLTQNGIPYVFFSDCVGEDIANNLRLTWADFSFLIFKLMKMRCPSLMIFFY